MLISLYVENIALIKKLSLELSGGFCVLTGETGAGKSIIVDAVNMLCGARSERELIRTGEEFAFVEGVFDNLMESEIKALAAIDIEADEDGLVFLSRTIRADGKSSAKINGRTVPISMLRNAADKLIRIHGQQDTRSLSDTSSFVTLLDKYAGNSTFLKEYKTAYNNMIAIKKELDAVETDEAEKLRRSDYLGFAINEIESAKISVEEEERLNAEKLRLQNAEKITSASSDTYKILYGGESGTVSQLLDVCVKEITPLIPLMPELENFTARLESARLEIDDIAFSLSELKEDDISNLDVKLDKIEESLAAIHDLKRKYGGSVEAVILTLENFKNELEKIVNTDEYIKKLSQKLAESKAELQKKAEILTQTRKDASQSFGKRMYEELAFLDMEKLKFEVEVTEKEYSNDGADNIRFLITVNKGEPPKPIEKVASGGELSRIMLALMSVISQADGAGTIIFDEIDTGISGATSRKIGLKLLGLTQLELPVQVVCVTHSAQIAALADEHLKITKDEEDGRTYTYANLLNRQGRIDELSRIIGGIDSSGAISAAAEELLERKDFDLVKDIG